MPDRISTSPTRSAVLLLLGAVLVAAVALFGRSWLDSWTRHRMHQRSVAQLRELPDDAAVHWVSQLHRLDVDAIPVLTLALADEREPVAQAASQSIHTLLSEWEFLPPADASPRVALLARYLESQATRIPGHRRPLIQPIAQRLLVWPIDPEAADVGATIASCETVLRLPLAEQGEIRIAALPQRPVTKLPADVELPPAAPIENVLPTPLPTVLSEPPPPARTESLEPGEPQLLPGATRERPVEPKRFLPPRATRIEG